MKQITVLVMFIIICINIYLYMMYKRIVNKYLKEKINKL